MKINCFFLIIFSFFLMSTTSAQTNLVGVGASYSTALERPAIHAKFDSWFTKQFGAGVELENYFLEGDNQWTTIGFRLKYNFMHNQNYFLYIFGGAHVISWSSETINVQTGQTYNGTTYISDATLRGGKKSELGGHLGFGVTKPIQGRLYIFAEAKSVFNPRVVDLTTFHFLNHRQFIPTLGLAYRL